MIKLQLKADQVREALRSRVGEDGCALLDDIRPKSLPEIAYTSYDGDNYSHAELIKQYCLRQNLVPMHPGSALGMYIAILQHKSKKPIVEDCIRLIGIADRFFVFNDSVPLNDVDVSDLPEGLLAELAYWVRHKNRHVTHVDVTQYTSEIELQYDKRLIGKLDKDQKQEVDALSKSSQTRPITYLLSGEKYAKYVDWMTKDALARARVPLPPCGVISHSTLQLAFPGDRMKHLYFRLALGLKADEIALYGSVPARDFELSALPKDALEELYLLLRFKPELPVTYTFFGETDIPKFVDLRAWAITEREKHG